MHIYNVLLKQVYEGYFHKKDTKPENVLFCYGTADKIIANVEPSHEKNKYYVTLVDPNGNGIGRFLWTSSTIILAATTDQTFIETHLEKFDSFFED